MAAAGQMQPQCAYPPPTLPAPAPCAYAAAPAVAAPQASAPAVPSEENLQIPRSVLESMLENRHEDSVLALAEVATERYGLASGQSTQEQLLKVLEALAWWIRDRAKAVDSMIPVARDPATIRLGHHLWQCLAWAPQNTDPVENLVDGFYGFLNELMGERSGCLTSAAIGKLVEQEGVRGIATLLHQELVWAMALLAAFSNTLLEIQEKVAWAALSLKMQMEDIDEATATTPLIEYFHNFSVDVEVPGYALEAFPEGSRTPNTGFSVTLINTYGSLTRFLELLRSKSGLMLAVDSEGINLGAQGDLVLMQIACYDDRSHVYVIDIQELGREAFELQLLDQFSLRGVLENQSVRKVWFDPRRDVDALWHQFGFTPKGICDVQLAEILDRRKQNVGSTHRHSQTRCLQSCTRLTSRQKVFAEWINDLGKKLFEPKFDGKYEVFRERPLKVGLLVYSAHDARYLFDLYEQYLENIGEGWMAMVDKNSDRESRFYIDHPGSDATSYAPDFSSWALDLGPVLG
mmetsp:Transcript_64495/g.154008  ORF Transcript_64495/g.154008 Transcript_64495/m.154008 type:complete len:518 (-) Transcript_64495:65-1618(-)